MYFNIDLLCNAEKTVCVVFPPMDKRKVVMSVFPCFKLNDIELKYVNEFKYVVHRINNGERDDIDVLQRVRAMFTRTNLLVGLGYIQTQLLHFLDHFVFFME